MKIAGAVGFHVETGFVHQPVVAAAERYEVVELGFAAVCPVFDVVAFDEAGGGAARKAAAAVARVDGEVGRGTVGGRVAAARFGQFRSKYRGRWGDPLNLG